MREVFRSMRVRLLAGASALLLAGLTVAMEIPIGAQQRATPTVAEQEAAFRQGGLHAAARLGGSYKRTIPISQPNAPSDLLDLVRLAQHIVVATVDTNRSQLVEGGRSIVLITRLNIQRTLKGGLGETASVVTPGGQITFSDGSVATVRASGAVWPGLGDRDVWFLQRATGEVVDSEAPTPIFEPLFGPLGVYPLFWNDRTVIAAGLHPTPLANRVLRMKLTSEAFVTYIEGVLKR